MKFNNLVKTAGVVLTASMVLAAATITTAGAAYNSTGSRVFSQNSTKTANVSGSGEKCSTAETKSDGLSGQGTNGRAFAPGGPQDQQRNGSGMIGLSQLVEDGTITEEQAEAVQSAMKEARESDTTADLETILASLVEDGTLTQEESDAITEALPEGGVHLVVRIDPERSEGLARRFPQAEIIREAGAGR